MNNHRLENALKAIERAQDAIDTARHDLIGGFPLAAVSRAYYVVFYCMSGLLMLHDVHVKTHKGVQIKFRELFVLTEIFDFDVAATIQVAFQLRQKADYDMDVNITLEEASDLIKDAQAFYNITKKYLQKITAV